MIIAREAQCITSKIQSPEFYWKGRADRKIKAAARDGFSDTELRIYDTQFLPNTELQELLLADLISSGFSAKMTKTDEHVCYSISWSTSETDS